MNKERWTGEPVRKQRLVLVIHKVEMDARGCSGLQETSPSVDSHH